MQPSVDWQIAAPIWSGLVSNGHKDRFRQPAILRFTRDTFMEDLQTELAKFNALAGPSTGDLNPYLLRPETWEDSEATWLSKSAFDLAEIPKLYQPAHGRFYLVATSLTCRIPGLPDKVVDTGNEEEMFFVLRKLVNDSGNGSNGYIEYGWQGNHWQQINDPGQNLAANEERLALFPLTYQAGKRQRRLLAGFIPVANRETYQAAPAAQTDPPPADDPLADPRLAQFEAVVISALSLLAEAADPAGPATLDAAKAREVFIFALLDLALFLKNELPNIWDARNGSGSSLEPYEKDVFDVLKETLMFETPDVIWFDVLAEIEASEAQILVGDLNDGLTFTIDNRITTTTDIFDAINTIDLSTTPTSFYDKVAAALKNTPPASSSTELEALAALAQIDTQADGTLYAIRCVYQRPSCQVTQLHSSLKARVEVSQKTEYIISQRSPIFQLAGFFDPQAPFRPIRIPTPLDTSLDGLRKFPKNVSVLISNELRKQVDQIQGVKLKDLDDGNLDTGGAGFELGMICSFSIPIITICALILLMIIVQLLNIIFWWLPFFKICLPIPLKAKA